MRMSCFFISALLALSLNAQAKGGSSGGSHSSFSSSHSSSSSFSHGFSSPKSSPSSASLKSSSTPLAKPSFGSFGSARPVTTSPTEKSSSPLTASLDKNAAQSKALAAHDSNNATTSASPSTSPGVGMPPTVNNSFGNSSTTAPNSYSAPSYSAPGSTTIINNSSGSNGFMWFMLGQSMSHSNYDRGYNNGGYNPSSGSFSRETTASHGDSAGVWFLRIFVWLLILGGLGGGIWYFLKRRNDKVLVKNNYSLD